MATGVQLDDQTTRGFAGATGPDHASVGSVSVRADTSRNCVVGAAERALKTLHRPIVEDVAEIVGWATAPYDSTSAFRFAYDPDAPRHLADASAVAQEIGVLARAMVEEPLPLGSQLDTDDDDGDGDRSKGGADSAAPSGAVVTAESLLIVPSRVAAREKADQACRALENGWHAEAERLFVAGTDLAPTEPFLWFGAGLAASSIDAARAAEHLYQASRYLLPVDQSGAAYTSILAAALLERQGEVTAARRFLQRHVAELDTVCPAISLHLARLGADRRRHLADALGADPMLNADIAALGMDADDVIRDRRQRTVQEISQLDLSIGELRRVVGDLDRTVEAAADDDLAEIRSLPLARTEVALWRKIALCESQLSEARGFLQSRIAARQVKEAQVAEAFRMSRTDLQHHTTVPFFFSALMVAFAMVAVFVVGTLARSVVSPVASTAIAGLIWVFELALLAWVVRLFLKAWWPYRSYVRARQAKIDLPTLEAEAARLRDVESEVRRRNERASEDAELRIRRIVERRRFLIPRRPRFMSS